MARIDNLSNFLSDVATSIKAKTGSTTALKPVDFDTAIASIEGSGTGGITPVGTIDITANGEHNVTNYATANVNVPVGVFPEGELEITSNGTHAVTNYASVKVNVPTGGGASFTSEGFANDSWETIAAISEAGMAASYYNIGDTKTIQTTDCTDEGGYYNKDWTARELTLTIVGFNHYPLASDATKTAGIVLMVEDEDIQISAGGQYYGWPGATRLKSWLNGAFMGGLPADLQSKIKEVTPTTFNGYNDTLVTTNDKIFLPSCNEVGMDSTAGNQEDENTRTLWFFGDMYKRAVFFKHTDDATYKFWLRSMGTQDHYLAAIQSDGVKTCTLSYPATSTTIHIKPLFNV